MLADGRWELTGFGAGFGDADSVYYVQQTVGGDFTAVARVESLTSDGTFPQVGLMIREGLAVDARFVSVAATWTNQYWAARHVLAGTALEESALDSTYVYPDAWVALVRSGDTVAIYTSSDGQDWFEEQTVTVPALADSVNVGLFISSGTAGVEATATVSEFGITP
jgi:regulation of enolase protein 1 (concanavalin A-like superfamily)